MIFRCFYALRPNVHHKIACKVKFLRNAKAISTTLYEIAHLGLGRRPSRKIDFPDVQMRFAFWGWGLIVSTLPMTGQKNDTIRMPLQSEWKLPFGLGRGWGSEIVHSNDHFGLQRQSRKTLYNFSWHNPEMIHCDRSKSQFSRISDPGKLDPHPRLSWSITQSQSVETVYFFKTSKWRG